MTKGRRTLLVLAASFYQLEAIRIARRLGYRVVTVDNVPANPGHALADRSYEVDTTDLAGVLRVAEREEVSGVLAACTDVAVPTAAYVSEALGLPGQPFASARILTSKTQFRQFLAAHQWPAPKFFPVEASFDPAEVSFSNCAWILKPDRSSGCKGTFIVRSEAELRERLPETLAFSPNRQAVLEEFILGHQGTCEGVVQEGRVALSFVLDRQTAPAPYATTVGHYCPSLLPENQQERLLALIAQIFEELGIRETVFDCDFVATADEVFLLELTPRAGGNCIADLLRRATGFDLMEYAVRLACGDHPQWPASIAMRPAAVLLLGVWKAGRLQYDEAEAEELRQEKWVDSLTLDVAAGASVQPFSNGRHRAGEAFIYGADRADLEARAASLRQRLNLRAE